MPSTRSPPAATGGAALLLSLPDDVLSLISLHLRPPDLARLSLTCRSLHSFLISPSADKLFLSQCLLVSPSPSLPTLWRPLLPSYRHLLRFLLSSLPLLGLWVHQNPELGNVVFVRLGFLSLVACRVIPQDLSPSNSLLWAPVFEILADPLSGSPSLLFLHGSDSLHPGSVASIHPLSNVLLLEADVAGPHARSSPHPFGKLAFGDRRRLLDQVASKVRQKIPPDLAAAPLFGEDDTLLARRRLCLLELHKRSSAEIGSIETKTKAVSNGASITKRRGLLSIMKQLMGRPNSLTRSSSVGSESKHVALDEFLMAGETVGLALRATNMRLSTYRAWPNMHDNKFALYKLPLQEVVAGRQYAGLWGGTFGWPPGRPSSEDKPGKALFFLLLSYEEVEGSLLLIATKILEGTHYVLHPNGSAMFIVKVEEAAEEVFPWETDGDGQRVEVKCSYGGEGIANGYGFRYPGSKPGSLFEIQNGVLAFVWKVSKSVLTLQRLDLEELLKRGERVPTLPPIANFAYLTKSYSNVFAGFPGTSSCSASPR